MYKIAFWLNSLGIGGTEKTAILFSKYLNEEKYFIDFFTYGDADLTRKDQILKIPLDIRYIKRNDPDWSVLRTYDLVHSFRAGSEEKPSPGLNFHGPKFVETNVFGILSNNSKINKSIFMSEWLMNDTLTKYNIVKNHPRFTFINNPVEDTISNGKFQFFPDNCVILGRAGRPDNGVYDNINVLAAKKLKDQGYNLAFLCLGCPSAMQRDLNELGIKHAIVEPTVDELTISKFYNSIDIMAWARPDGETGGSAIQEAMMHGKPVVVYKAEPLYAGMGVWQNQIELAKGCGFSTNRNIDEYAEKLKLLIDSPNLRQSFGENARKKALINFEASICANKLEKIYDEIL